MSLSRSSSVSLLLDESLMLEPDLSGTGPWLLGRFFFVILGCYGVFIVAECWRQYLIRNALFPTKREWWKLSLYLVPWICCNMTFGVML
jgi:hypothetical protein